MGGSADADGDEQRADPPQAAAFTLGPGGEVRDVTPRGEAVARAGDRPIRGRSIDDLSGSLFTSGTARRYRTAVEGLDGDGTAASFRTAVDVSGELSVPYRVGLHAVTSADQVAWSMAEETAPEEGTDGYASLSEATAAITDAETVESVYAALDSTVRWLLLPTAVEIRTLNATSGTLRRIDSGYGGPPVDGRETVSSSEPPYDTLLPADAVQYREEVSFPEAAYGTLAVAPLGTGAVLLVGWIGRGIGDRLGHALETVIATARSTLRALEAERTVDRQQVSLDRYEVLFESIPHPVYTTDEGGELSLANQRFNRQFGHDPDGGDGIHVSEFVTDDSAERLQAEVRRLLESPDDCETTVGITGIHSDGRQRQYEASVSAVSRGDEYAGTVGVLQDVTDRERQREITTVLNRALRHNLRTSTNNIMGYAEVTESRVSGELADYMEIIKTESEWLMKLGNTLREVRRSVDTSIEGGLVITAENLIEPVVREYRREHPEATIEVHYSTTGKLEGGKPLRRALENVIENAIVHNEGAAAVEIWVADAPDPGWVDIYVEDDGPGIPNREIDLLVGETEITPLQHGSGIGLWVTRWLVDVFDGELVIDTDADGSVVTLRLRRVRG